MCMLNVEQSIDELVVSILTENLEAANTESFKEDLLKIVPPHNRTLVIDLAHVRFMDSSGIGTLLGLMTRFDPDAKTLRLRNAQSQIINLIKMLRLEEVLIIED